MPEKPYHAAIERLPRETLMDGLVSRSATRTDGSLLVFNWMQPDQPEPAPHDHPFDQLSVVWSGAIEMELDGDRYTVRGGELLYIPARVPHSGRAVGPDPALILDLFAPAREDYLHLVEHQPA